MPPSTSFSRSRRASHGARAPLRDPEAGYMLVTVVVMVALVLIALSVAAPIISKDIRRDKEVESEHRAQQYVRAIRLFYRKTHNYPGSIDALKQTNNVRFLRQEYVDPLTGKADWKLLHLGEPKTTVKGFFGQELGGIASGGLGSAAGQGSGVGSPIGAGTAGSSSTIGGTSALASGFSGATVGTSGTGATGASGASGATGASGSTGGVGGTGGVVVGVGTAATGNSILSPNKQTTYDTWEFWYDPRIELLYQKGKQNAGVGTGTLGSQPASGAGSGAGTGLGSGFGSTTPGASTTPTTTTSPTTTTTPTTTPQ